MDFDGLKEALIQMISGEKIKIRVMSFQNDMTSIRNRDDVFTLLVYFGYLAYDSREKMVYIPNEEVRQEFLLAVENGKPTSDYDYRIEMEQNSRGCH